MRWGFGGAIVSVAACAALLGAVPAGAVGAASSIPASARATTAFVCGRGLDNPPCEQQPNDLAFSDNNDLVASGLAWTSWGKPVATGRGVLTVKWTGTPSRHRGTVRLSDLRTCHGQPVYRKGRVSWPGQSVVVTFDCRALPGQPRYFQFHSSDRSLGCGMSWDPKDGSWVRCDVSGAAYTTPRDATCTALDQGDSLMLGTEVTSSCHGDTVLRAGRVLAAGHGHQVGDIRCSMAATGVTCRNAVSGHGFRMSRDSYEIW